MTATLLSGKPISEAIKAEVAADVASMLSTFGFTPCLVVIRVGEDPASAVYVGSKVRTAEELGIISEQLDFPRETSEERIVEVVKELNSRADVDGILVQLPLPDHIDERTILELIDPAKDVDGFHPINAGRLMQGHEALTACTPAGVIEVLKRSDIPIAGKNAVVVGRSNIVGKPMAILLLRENATVTICHSRTANLTAICSRADILIAAIGRAGFIRGEHIGDGSTVIDVGINRLSDPVLAASFFGPDVLEKRLAAIETRGFTLVGDVNPREALEKAAFFTPVPGGIGLLTVAMLMKNTLTAARARRSIHAPIQSN
ncbi:MAG: bifunctional 5,10-methylenetetrahydrofolate dehydrogenase/5,10-methenyltetrahydrofolate cyclohydrolase [Acidobacteriota bacterium]